MNYRHQMERFKFGEERRNSRLRLMLESLDEQIAEFKSKGQFQMAREAMLDRIAVQEAYDLIKPTNDLKRHALLLAEGVLNEPVGSYDCGAIAKNVKDTLGVITKLNEAKGNEPDIGR